MSSSSSSSPVVALPPRKNPTPTKISRAHLTPLQTLLQLGFPSARAEKALVATGNRGVQLASDWLLAHVNDPTLDEKTPRNYVLYLCPNGALHDQLQTFWDASRTQIGWNGAHNSFPHITLTSAFQCEDEKLDALLGSIKSVAQQFARDFDGDAFKLEKYVSPNFLGLFAGKKEEILLRSFAQEICASFSSLGVNTEPMSKAHHVTLAYQFAPAHCAGLEDLSASIDIGAECQWELRLYSYEERTKNHDVFKVLFAHVPREEDELELMIGDFAYVTQDEMKSSTDGWVLGLSWLTGCQGYLPKNYIQQTAETNAWTLHLSLPMTKPISSSNPVLPSDVKDVSNLLRSASPCPSSTSSVERLKGSTTSLEKKGGEAASECGKDINQTQVKSNAPRKVFISRHGERVDFTFGTWIPFCFDDKGNYLKKDLNMPSAVPKRRAGPEGFLRDCPLTCIGETQARLLGEAMKEAGVQISQAYSSPSLRCVQTCHNILIGMGLQQSIKISLEPGLFEWLGWYHNSMPDWMTPEELSAANFNIELKYKPYISADELQDTEEDVEQYYTRNFFVSQCILQATESKGGNLLFVGHAATLDVCTRQMTGQSPRPVQEFMSVLRKVPYCSLGAMEEVVVEGAGGGGNGSRKGSKQLSWKIIEPPVPPMTHCSNARFDWKVLTDPNAAAAQSHSKK